AGTRIPGLDSPPWSLLGWWGSILGGCPVSCNRVRSVMQGGDRDFTSWQPWCTSGEWLRCALHAHTTGSDGELAPDLLAAHYARGGYDVLAVTDHWQRTEAAAEGILVVPGVEFNCVLPDARDGHVLGFGVTCAP